MTKTKTGEKTLRLVQLAFLTAIIVVLQILSYYINVGTISISLVLLPIVIGAMLFGPTAGAYLGGVFGVVVYIACAVGLDKGGFILFEINPFITFGICIIKGIAAGFIAGLIFKLLASKIKNVYVQALISAALAPVVNTLLFCSAMLIFFRETLTAWAGGTEVLTYVFVGLIGINFLIEFLINVVICPIVVTALMKHKKL